MQRGLVGSEMCIRDRVSTQSTWDRTLTSLYIHSNNIGVAGAKSIASALKSNVSLTTLYLWNNNIGDTGTESIAGALTTNSTLTELSLGSNKIGDIGAKFLADALISNYTLQDLYLSCSNMSESSKLLLEEAARINGGCKIDFIWQIAFRRQLGGSTQPHLQGQGITLIPFTFNEKKKKKKKKKKKTSALDPLLLKN
eukprot:TRINITY_DN17103_c0_g1_i7.p1 TRINITY_DN17103_c0_g1~~TRINITY_DN17103_c0_g1_i7.p1  ORF type:complete len:197 (+),score=26.50 TRINITY_DN17103_c0_g1_i7:172-762(+)